MQVSKSVFQYITLPCIHTNYRYIINNVHIIQHKTMRELFAPKPIKRRKDVYLFYDKTVTSLA